MDPNFEVHWTRHRLIRAYKFMKLLRVEPYLFLIMFQMSLKGAPGGQLLQDKICRNWYNQSVDYCYNLPSTKENGPGPGHYKSQILGDVAQFGTYTTYISTVPALLWALFVGAWIDRYVRGRKILMILSVGAAIVENLITIYLSLEFETSVYYNLLLHIPTSLCGGHIASRIAITHYMTSTTPPKLMAMRFMIFEMCMFVASPIGSSLGGYLLVQKPMFNTGEIRNYSLCFIIALGFEVVAFLWIVFMVNERVARKQEMRIEMKIQGIRHKTNGKENNRIKLRSDMSKEDEARHPIRLLFDLENIRSMVRTCIKPRPNKARTQLFLMFASMIIMVMAFSGGGHISGQFIQKIYLWTPDWDAYMKSLNMVVHSIATVTIVPFLIKGLKVTDIPLAIIGYCSNFIKNILIGTWLSPIANYISMPITAVGGLSSIGTRSHMTKIVGRDEIGKVMSFNAALDTLAPMFASTVFTYIFKYTMDSYPGLVYQITALLALFPILVFMWIDLFTERPIVEGHDKFGKSRHHGHNKDVEQGDKQVKDPSTNNTDLECECEKKGDDSEQGAHNFTNECNIKHKDQEHKHDRHHRRHGHHRHHRKHNRHSEESSDNVVEDVVNNNEENVNTFVEFQKETKL